MFRFVLGKLWKYIFVINYKVEENMTFRCVPTFQAASNDSSSTWVSFLQLTIKLRYSPVDVGDDGVGPKRFFAILDFSNIII